MNFSDNKPRLGDLTAQLKAENKVVSGERVFVEHMIRLVNIFRVASGRFRLDFDTYEQVKITGCGLASLRIGALILPVLFQELTQVNHEIVIHVSPACCYQELSLALMFTLAKAGRGPVSKPDTDGFSHFRTR